MLGENIVMPYYKLGKPVNFGQSNFVQSTF